MNSFIIFLGYAHWQSLKFEHVSDHEFDLKHGILKTGPFTGIVNTYQSNCYSVALLALPFNATVSYPDHSRHCRLIRFQCLSHHKKIDRVTILSKMENKVLGYVDYIVFGLSLVISLLIGIYYSRSGGKQRSVEEYLMGNRRITCLPVALSLLVTFQSGISLLGLPVEIYYYGTQIYMGVIGLVIGYTIVAAFIVPVLYPLQITSVYEVFNNLNSRTCTCISYRFISYREVYSRSLEQSPMDQTAIDYFRYIRNLL